jgi:hypothetical protein
VKMIRPLDLRSSGMLSLHCSGLSVKRLAGGRHDVPRVSLTSASALNKFAL